MIAENQSRALDHDKVRDFYDGEYYGDYPGAAHLPWHAQVVADRLGNLRDKAVLDIACGAGQWLAELHRRGAVPAGIDISRRAVERCRCLLPNADIRDGVAEALPFDDDRFDVITCLGSLEHFLDQSKALHEMKRVAKTDASFLILVPNAGFLTRRLRLYQGTGQSAVRETVRSIVEWEVLLNDAGLSVLARWRDLHPISVDWISKGPAYARPVRAAQAVALALWPIAWQYQVYFHCASVHD